MNEEFMSMGRIAEREYVRKNIMKQASLNEEIICKHGKFENLWKGPYQISAFHGNNTYILQEIDGTPYAGGPVNGRFLKHYD